MKAQELLRAQFEMAHQFIEMTIADCSQEILDKAESGWTINPIGALYAHVATSEDAMVNGMAKGGELRLMRDGWSERLGISDPRSFQDEHSTELKADLPALREYAATVFKDTDQFLANATDTELEREMDMPGGGKGTVLQFLANIGSTHVTGHWGEIAALKGVQGLKGLPF